MTQASHRNFVEKLLAQTGRGPEATIPILQGIQRQYRYLPEEALRCVSELTGIRLAELVGVATFYHQFRLQPVGKNMIRVCHGTACHVKGAQNIHDAVHRHLKIPDGQDTDAAGEFTVERVACLGCCTLAPVVQAEHTTYGHLTADTVPAMVEDFLAAVASDFDDVDRVAPHEGPHQAEIRVGLGSCCMAKGSDQLFHLLRDTVKEFGIDAAVKRVGCVGMCHATPIVEVRLPTGPSVFYEKVSPADAEGIIRRHFRPRSFSRRIFNWVDRTLTELVSAENGSEKISRHELHVHEKPVESFMGRQVRIATEGFGELDPLDLDEYLAHDGFKALGKVLSRSPELTIAEVSASGLHGRGGAGFPTGFKWKRVRDAAGLPMTGKNKNQISNDWKSPSGAPKKYVIVNGDEGDPGAFMDRMLLESFPYRVIEGMLIAAWSVGADEGYVYVRAEYPRAVTRMREAIRQLEERGFLGEKIMQTKFNFRLHIFEGAGAFICGEETALIESIEGRRGIPRMKPPFPADCGLWNKPTLINNVETFAMVPWIVRHGAPEFAKLGTEKSKGTKVFALAGEVIRAGLIEVPMGITLREIVEDIGGGTPGGKKFKAVQIGGPSGGCVPSSLENTPIDFEALQSVGAIMGSGGLIVLDEKSCMVDVARFFMSFLRDESCGQCTFCRIGTMRMYEILDKICQGKGERGDLDELEKLAGLTKQGSICGLGRTAPNPVITTLRYFRDEYEAHLAGKCPAGKCKPLIKYVVQDNCTGCTICAQRCPVGAIPLTPYRRHEINSDICTRCDVCRTDCPEHAIAIESGGTKCAGNLEPVVLK